MKDIEIKDKIIEKVLNDGFLRGHFIKRLNYKNDKDVLLYFTKDKSAKVREKVAEKIPIKHLSMFINDPCKSVLWMIFNRDKGFRSENFGSKLAIKRINDKKADIRELVACFLPKKHLFKMMNDKVEFVRREVAKRIDQKYLHQMMNDEHWYVRYIVARRIDQKGLRQMINDEDYNVRREVAERIDQKYLSLMINDENECVKDLIKSRFGEEKEEKDEV